MVETLPLTVSIVVGSTIVIWRLLSCLFLNPLLSYELYVGVGEAQQVPVAEASPVLTGLVTTQAEIEHSAEGEREW